jgi:hypothetical protein
MDALWAKFFILAAPRAFFYPVESVWDSQEFASLIQHAGWNGGQGVWRELIQTIFGSELLRLRRLD